MNADTRELAADFDLERLTPEFYADPYPTYRALREKEPVKRLPNGSYFLTLVTMRGEWGEFNPWQVPMGSSTAAVFELSGIKVLRATHAEEVREVVEAAAGQAYNACTPTAVLLSQRLIGAKVFTK